MKACFSSPSRFDYYCKMVDITSDDGEMCQGTNTVGDGIFNINTRSAMMLEAIPHLMVSYMVCLDTVTEKTLIKQAVYESLLSS